MENNILKVIAVAGEKIANLESTASLKDYQISELREELEACKERLKSYEEGNNV